ASLETRCTARGCAAPGARRFCEVPTSTGRSSDSPGSPSGRRRPSRVDASLPESTGRRATRAIPRCETGPLPERDPPWSRSPCCDRGRRLYDQVNLQWLVFRDGGTLFVIPSPHGIL